MQFDDIHLEIRGALKSNHGSSKEKMDWQLLVLCYVPAIIDEHGIVEGKYSSLHWLYVEILIFVGYCERD